MKSVLLDWSSLPLMLSIILDVLSLRSAGVCPEDDWVKLQYQHICVMPGSSVVIPCSFTPPAGKDTTEVFWLINAAKGVEPTDIAKNLSYNGRVQYIWDRDSNKNNCTLRLSDVKMTDSAGYRARIIAGSDKWHSCSEIQLSVTNLTVLIPEPVVEGLEVKLICRTTCSLEVNSTIIWRKNGEDVQDLQTHNSELLFQRVSSEDEGDYSCALKGHEGHPSKPVKLNVKFSPKKTSVSVTPIVITKGSSMTLTCSSDANPPVEDYTWFKVNESTPVGSGQQYNITVISSEDEGQYYCEARNKYGSENSTAVSIAVNDHIPVVYMIAGASFCGAAGLLCLLVWIRRNRRDKEKAPGAPRAKDESEYASAQARHNTQSARGIAEDDVQYATVQPKHNRQITGEAEDDVQYASVQFKKAEGAGTPQGSPGQPEEDHSVIYSSVQRTA